ncbi:MAG TPA: response regulator [Oligoflexia bacterium]|nr:response regulator [Oligoflexia bacterium]
MGKKLLVADDSATIQKVIKLALSSEGYDILAVSDGREAVRAIQEERPDIVLIDVALSNGDAYTVKKAINQDSSLAGIRFILMASAFEKVDEKAASGARFDSRLIKPFDPSHLRKMISDLLKSPATPTAAPPPPAEVPVGGAVTVELSTEDEAQAKEISDFIAVTPPAPPQSVPEITVFDGMESTPSEVEAESDVGEEEDLEATQALTHEEARALENDIRDLTESTIKMSEPDELEWSLNDDKKMRTAPVRSSRSETEASFDGEKTVELAKVDLTGRRGIVSAPTKAFDDGGSNFLKIGLEQSARGSDATRTTNIMSPQSSTDESPSKNSNTSGTLPFSQQELEVFVQKDIQEVIERLAKEMVPKIAENLIRKEIEKILSEP